MFTLEFINLDHKLLTILIFTSFFIDCIISNYAIKKRFRLKSFYYFLQKRYAQIYPFLFKIFFVVTCVYLLQNSQGRTGGVKALAIVYCINVSVLAIDFLRNLSIKKSTELEAALKKITRDKFADINDSPTEKHTSAKTKNRFLFLIVGTAVMGFIAYFSSSDTKASLTIFLEMELYLLVIFIICGSLDLI